MSDPAIDPSPIPGLKQLFDWRNGVAWLVLVFTLLVQLVLFQHFQNREVRAARQQFHMLSEKVTESIRKRLLDHEQILLGGAGLFDASGTVSREQWRLYVQRLQLADHYPGIQGVGFSRAIRPEELEAHERRVQQEGLAEYAVHPPGQRPLYTSIVYLEPLTARNRAALGFDMYSDPARRQAMQRAAEQGLTSITDKVTLVQETHGKTQAGVLLYVPVYQQGMPLGSPEQRMQALKGFVGYFDGGWREAAAALDEADALFTDRCSGVVWETTICRRFSLGALMYLGEIAELCRRVPLYLAEAKERGNTYLGNTARSRLNLVWLAADDPDAARRQLDRSRSTEMPGQFTVGRFNELISRVQADLYCGDAEAASEGLQETWPELEKSLLQRVRIVRVEALQARGRCALARAADAGGDDALLGVAAQAANQIKANKRPWSDPLATLLEAGIANVQGDGDGCRFKLRGAAEGFDAAAMALYAAAARRRLGEVSGDQGMVDEAGAWMRAQRIVHPERMTAMLAPGF